MFGMGGGWGKAVRWGGDRLCLEDGGNNGHPSGWGEGLGVGSSRSVAPVLTRLSPAELPAQFQNLFYLIFTFYCKYSSVSLKKNMTCLFQGKC